ncbi:hypothetical protein JRQ81_009049, partial [Phrynocephalus forsythii]
MLYVQKSFCYPSTMASSRLVARTPRDIAGVMQRLQDEQESVQKRTFTKWINTHLAKHIPPMVVNDLFEDIKDGIILIALLEVLSGQKLPCEQGRKLKRIHGVANIGTALKFLEGRRIKLVNINSTDIADGRPSIVLGLIWTIILYFQIEELTSNLPQLQSLSSSTSSVDSVVSSETASPPSKRKVVTKVHGTAKKALLKWVQYTAAKQAGIEIKDFGQSWRSGVAFHSVIHAIRPELVDLERVKMRSNRENLEEAFTIAESELGIPRLLDPEDVDVEKPDEKSVMTYVAQFLKHYPDPHNAASDAQDTDKEERLRDLKIWVEQFERDLTRAQMIEASLQEKYQSLKYYRTQYELKRKQIELAVQSQRKDGKLSLDQALVKQAWDRVTSRLFEWHLHLDKSLPAPLGTIGAWLYRAETFLREEIIIQQAHEETADMIHRKLEQHKDVLKNVDGYKRTFQEIHRAQSVNGVPVPSEQLDDMAERFNFVASTSELHLMKMEFLELKYRLLSLLVFAESKLKSWIIKYGRRESVELLLQNYITVIENNNFFEQYEVTYQILKKAAEMYAKVNGSPEEIESVTRFMNETTTQWRHLSVEVRSVKSMLEEVISNWDRYNNTVASLQAWLEDAEKMLNQPEHAKKDFFRHLPQWIQQHTAMNDAGNFLIETCDETISRDLKQQLLLLNGRWRELFMQVKQYARTDELDRLRKDYLDGVATLSAFIDEAKRKIHIPLEVSFLNVQMFIQEMEDVKQKVPVMESQYKMVARTAQHITKEAPQEEVNEMLATMSRIKGQLTKANESCPVVLYESQQLLPHLEELEKQITNFYESLQKINEILSVLNPETQPADIFKQQHQDLVAYEENCKKALSQIERNSQSIAKFVSSSKVLRHFSVSVLQKKIMDVQTAFQNMVKKTGDWKKNVEANNRLMKKFEASKTELDNVLQTANSCLKERGDPEELLRKHSDFFSQLDQRVLNAFLKACDELTDILPENEQHTLQEAVRKLHKQWKDLQSEAPYHLLHLKIEVEKSKFLASVEECQAELARQQDLMSKESSEKIIREHKLLFGDKGPLQLCEKRLHLIKDLCLKLPEWDPLKKAAESSQKDLSELKSRVASTYKKLLDHPDKWKDYKKRFSDLQIWTSSRETQLQNINHNVSDTAKYKHFKASIEEIRQEACKQGENLIWLKSRLASLAEISSEDEARKQGDELSELSNNFKRLLASLAEIEKTLGALGDCVQYTEEVKGHLEELITNTKETQAEAEKILDVESLLQAQQLLQYHQQRARQLHAKRQDIQQQMARGKQLQIESGVSPAVQVDLLELENTLENVQQAMDQRGDQLQITVNTWEQCERDKEMIMKYLSHASSALERILSFSSLESLSSELEKTKELSRQTVAMAIEAENLVKTSFAIQLGEKSKQVLQEKVKSIQEEVEKIEAAIEEDIKTMEIVKNKWNQFGKNFEALSIWITEKEKELDTLETSSSSLDEQINQIKVVVKEIDDKEKEIPHLEEDAQTFSQYLTSGESAHIKAKLTQIRRYWEELRDHAEHLERTITGKASIQQKFEENFTKLQEDLFKNEGRLAEIDTSCTSSAETYKVLQDLMDLYQVLEKMNQPLVSLSSGSRKITNKEKAAQDVLMLQKKYENTMKQVKDKQVSLETHLAQWQRLEKELSAFLTWLERCEASARPSEQHVSVDRVKLETELQQLQDLKVDITSHASLYASLLELSESLVKTSPNESVNTFKKDLEELDRRWKVLPQSVRKRISYLQSVIAEHKVYDELLLSFSDWIKQFLGKLHATSEINTCDQHLALCHKFLENDLRKKVIHAKEMCEITKETLKDFRSQKFQLHTFVAEMEDWLAKTEESLISHVHSLEPSGLNAIKKIQKELQQRQSNFDSTQETLNSLCRKYPSVELETLGGTVTSLMKKYEAVNQLSLKTQASVQESLEKHFQKTMQGFQNWYSCQKTAVKGLSIASGDSKATESKLHELQKVLGSVNEGRSKLGDVSQEGEQLYAYLPKSSVSDIQEQIAKAHQDFEGFLKQCLKDKHTLEECVAELRCFEDLYKNRSLWLQEMEDRIRGEGLGNRKQHIPEKKNEVQKMEAFLEEVLVARESFDQLNQKAQLLNEKGYSTGREVRLASQHFSAYQNLIKAVKEKLRTSQMALQEHQALEEALQSMWSWVKDVQEKLASAEGTIGSKDTLEKRLLQIQEILLMKGEGEIKLNMAIGKGEQAIKSSNEEGQKVIQNQLQTLKDLWSSIISTAVSCQSLLGSVINQWNDYLERKSQLDQWLDSVDHKVEQPLGSQNDLKEKFSHLDYFQAVVSEVEEHSKDMNQLMAKARDLHAKTEDGSFREDALEELKTQYSDIATVAKEKMRRVEDVVKDHLLYLDAVHEFTDWLHSAKEELHRWSDASGDSAAIQKKLAKINELIDSRQTGESRLNRVQALAPAVKKNTTAKGCKDIEAEMQALRSDWKQWEECIFQTQKDLQDLESQMALSEQEFTMQAAQLEEALQHFSTRLSSWSEKLTPLDSKHTDQEVVECWHREKEILDDIGKSEHMTDDIKSQLNDLCRFSKDLSTYSGKVSQLIKEYNSLCLQAAKGCQSKEQALQQRFRTAFRDFQQWLVNSKITTAKCFEVPQSVNEAAANVQKIQEFLTETESGQHKLNLVVSKGELLSSILPKENAKYIEAKVASVKEDWKKFISTLHQKEAALESLKLQMQDFEMNAEPLQDWLSETQKMVQDSSNRLHDLSAKRREQQKLQSVLEEIRCHEPQLNRLKEKAQQLWEEQAASKKFIHRVSQLSSQYLALSNVTKEKVSRMDRIVAEHQQFSHDLKELQDWMGDAIQMLESYCHPTADKNALDSRMAKLEGLLSVKQEKEIQMKMVLTRGESVLQNTSLEGAPVLEQQLRTLKDSWASLLSACIHCKSKLEGALSKWTSYQDDVRQFAGWMDKVEAIMNASERQCAELREKNSSLSRSKLLKEEVFSHNTLLETIETKGLDMTEHYVTQLELQDLQERYQCLKDRITDTVTKAEEMVHLHQEYQRNLKTFESWLEKEKEKLNCLSHLEGDAERHEATLRNIQELQIECAEGQTLLNAALRVREEVIPWGVPQLEDRILESVCQDWTAYQHKLSEVRTLLNTTLSRLRLMESKFMKVNEWLQTLEEKVKIRTGQQSDRATKEIQLQQMKKWHEEIAVYKDEVEEVSLLAQQILEETHTSSKMGRQATQLASRYQALILHVLEQIKFLEEEIRSMEESEVAFCAYKDWFGAALRKFRSVVAKSDVVDKAAMEKKMQNLEDLMSEMDIGHNLLKSAREKGERAVKFMERNEAEQLKRDISDCVKQLDEIGCSIRKEHITLEKCLHLTKEFLDKYKAQVQWLSEYQSILHATVDPKMELYEKKAQLSKYKSIQQTVLS